MTRRERLLATLRGQPVDRPPVCFYELDGLSQNPADPDPFNIYSHPSWKPLLDLTLERSDCIHRRGVPFLNPPPDPCQELTTVTTETDRSGNRLTTVTIRAGKRTLTSRHLREPDIDTVWTTEHLLKDLDDFRAWLDLPATPAGGEPETLPFLAAEARLGERGIAMVDVADPICGVAPLFSMEDFTVIALTEPALFHRALQKVAIPLYARVEAIAKALPGRLWRIVGPEYASPPYLPPRLFEEYIVRYDRPMVEAVQRYGGFARIHSHGRLRDILDLITSMGGAGLDPIEPPPQGDVDLLYVRQKYGRDLVLFGNLEISDIENLPTPEFRRKVQRALREGTAGTGRGFVLMPSASPYGRQLATLSVRNYEAMVELTEAFVG